MTDFLHPTELKKLHPYLAKKSLGQHFLVHRPILATIAKKILEHGPRTVLEIGPGPGSLSQLLAPKVRRLLLIEKDPQFRPILEEVVSPLGNIEIRMEDILKTDFSALIGREDQPAFAVGNLPYNASVAILQRLLDARHLFQRFYLMFQKEVALRLTAHPSTAAYGSLTLYCRMLADVKLLLPIPPSAFDPRPKVDSAVVEIVPLAQSRDPSVDLDFFQQVVQAAFNPRRKMLSNTLRGLRTFGRTKEDLEERIRSAGIDPKRRGETLTLEEFTKLTQTLSS
jgi:16S rRNA (adenine1518-N6/adenine1519-N6)-dimethyltransferase